MYRRFPHRGEKVRTVHNVQQVETMEDISKKLHELKGRLMRWLRHAQ
jgi:hypothetical protein